ncbi:DUF7373 family lipoprotein [Nocardia sp. NPDC004123]
MHRFDSTRRRVHAGSLVAVAALVSACAIAGAPRAATPQVGALDLGGYSGRPLVAPGAAGEAYGRLMESVRMADAVIAPRAVDPTLAQTAAIPVPTPEDAVGILADATRATLAAHGMLAGFSIGGTDDPTGIPEIGTARSVRLTVLRMRDNMTAIDAAREIDGRDFDVNHDNVVVPFSEYFATHGHWRTFVPTMAVTLAHGPFVVTLFVTHPATDLAALKQLAEATLDAELPKLDAFTPTPAEELSALPLDPGGMLSRLLPADPGKWPYPELFHDVQQPIAGWGGHRSARGIVYGPVLAELWVNRSGTDPRIPVESIAVTDSARLLRFPDAVAARHALNRLSEPSAGGSVTAPPAGVPDAVCLRSPGSNPAARESEYTCLVLAGRYLAQVSAPTEQLVHRMAAAQYALLVTDR